MTILATRVAEFDLYELYPAATVTVLKAGTSELASLFSDPAMTVEIANPQVLTAETIGNWPVGKFVQPVYTPSAYELLIDGTNRTGIARPAMTTLTGEDASYAFGRSKRYDYKRRLIDRFSDEVWVTDFGEWSTGEGSASTNTATLQRAVGAAAELGGAIVHIPAGSYLFTTVDLPAGVRLMGEGIDATVLRSSEAAAVVTLSGLRAGLLSLTLDGVNLTAGSIGVYGESADDTEFHDVTVKRFETGLQFKGARDFEWWELHVENCENGVDLLGDDANGEGDKMELGRWNGGIVKQCTVRGLFLSYEDRAVEHIALYGVDFKDNTGNAVEIEGARDIKLEDCYFEGNTVNLKVYDGSDATLDDNKVIGLYLRNSKMQDGECDFDGLCLDVFLERMDLVAVTFTLSIPDNKILLRDCTEDAQVTVAGDTSKLVRSNTIDVHETNGVTSDANAVVAASVTLDHGEMVYAEAKVIGNQRNGTGKAVYHISMAARRPAALLAYDAQTANFTVGLVLTGANSGATARIVADTDAGTSGTLSVKNVSGTFEDNETITDTGGGSATVNGTLTGQDTTLAVQSTLAYDSQVANYTAGQVVTGGTSGSKATIVSDADGGATGTLTLRDISGSGFVNNEALTDPLGGSALAAADLTLTSLSQVLRTAYEHVAAWDSWFAVSGADLQVKVIGEAAKTIDWTVRLDILRAP